MHLFYTRHARRRLRQRGITERDVEAVLANYEQVRDDAKGNRVYVGRPGGRRIKVVVDMRSNPWTVITAGD